MFHTNGQHNRVAEIRFNFFLSSGIHGTFSYNNVAQLVDVISSSYPHSNLPTMTTTLRVMFYWSWKKNWLLIWIALNITMPLSVFRAPKREIYVYRFDDSKPPLHYWFINIYSLSRGGCRTVSYMDDILILSVKIITLTLCRSFTFQYTIPRKTILDEFAFSV